MFTIMILLCGATECVAATPGTVQQTEAACRAEAEAIRQRGLQLIEQGRIEPHTFDYQCVAWGNRL